MARRVTKQDGTVELTRLEDVVTVTKRRDVHSVDPDTAAIVSIALGAGRPLIPLMLDGEDHTKYRKLLDPLFAPRQVAATRTGHPEPLGDADRRVRRRGQRSTSSPPSASRCPARSS